MRRRNNTISARNNEVGQLGGGPPKIGAGGRRTHGVLLEVVPPSAVDQLLPQVLLEPAHAGHTRDELERIAKGISSRRRAPIVLAALLELDLNRVLQLLSRGRHDLHEREWGSEALEGRELAREAAMQTLSAARHAKLLGVTAQVTVYPATLGQLTGCKASLSRQRVLLHWSL